MTALGYVGLVLTETPVWAFAVLGLLIFLGVRRLKSRVRRLAVVLVAPVAFGVWSMVNVVTYSQDHSLVVALGTLILLFAAGWASTRLYSDEKADRVGDDRFLFHGTPEPLITYLAVFAVRFGLEVWKGFEPSAALLAGALAIGVSAFVAGRTAQRASCLIQAPRPGVVSA